MTTRRPVVLVSGNLSELPSGDSVSASVVGAASLNVLKAGDTMTGALVVPLASAATPSLTFTGDLNTGIFSPGADQVAISTNGTGRLTVGTTAVSSTLAVDHPLGAVGTPSITFTGDLNTGFWSPAADTLAASTGGSERLRILSDGKVGLGTSSPQALLHLSSSTITESRYTATDTGGRTWRIGTGDNVSGLSGAFRIYDETGAATRLYITNAGQVGIGTTSPDALLTVNGIGAFGAGAVTTPSIAATGDLNTGFWFPAADTIAASTAGSERARIDSSGRLLVGTSTKVGSTEKKLEVLNGTIGLANFTATAAGASLLFEKGRGTSVGTIVQANDDLGSFLFRADDGVDSFTTAAQISAAVDGTPGANDMPGRLVFSTTADGAASPTERMRIRNNGAIGLGTAAPAATAHVGGNTIVSNVDVANASYDSISFSIAAQETNPAGLFFSNDGRKMFVTGSTGDDINEYTLSTPWNVSTATYVTVFSVAAQDTSPQDLYFRNDGKKLYVVGDTNNAVFQYTLSTPWSIASASYDSVSFSVATEDTTPPGLFFKSNGLAFYVVGATSDTVYRYNLTTAWDISTATLANSFSVTAQETNPCAISFASDGSRMFMLGTIGDDVNIYNLTTPWDITTALFVTVFSVAAEENNSTGLFVKPDGTKFYIVGTTNDTVFQYSIPSATIDLTGTTNINGSAEVAQDLTVYGGISSGSIQVADAGNITVGTTTGTKIGTATTQKLGFYNATPVVQPAAVANATTAVDVITQLNALLAKLRTLGIIAT